MILHCSERIKKSSKYDIYFLCGEDSFRAGSAKGINIFGLAKGFYFIQLRDKSQSVSTQKLIKN